MNKLANAISLTPPLWAVCLFLILPVLTFPEIIFGEQTLYRTDISWIHYPGHIFIAEEWLAGRVPLWDPYRQAGTPMLAELQIGVLYPLRILLLSPLSPSLELSLFILTHCSLAALFTFILARSLRMSQAAATLAGLIFGFGGFLMAQVSNVNIMTTATWLPLILFTVMQTTHQRSWLGALLGGIPLALQILSAHSQIVFYTWLIILGYGVYRLSADFFLGPDSIKRNITYALQTGLLLAATLISGLLLAAPQLLPAAELLQFSLRSQSRGLELLTETSLHPLMGLNLLVPSAFGNNVIGFKGGDPFQEVFIYVGLLPLFLVTVSRRGGAQTGWLFFLLMLAGTLLLALGQFTPLYQYVIQYLPGFDLFRIPARWLMGVNLALAVLAGFGLDRLVENGLSRRAFGLTLLAGLLLGLCLILIWVFKADFLLWSDTLNEPYRKLMTAFLTKSFTPNPIYQDRLLLRWLFGLNTPAFLLLTNLIIAAGLLALWQARRITNQTFANMVIGAVAIDLLLAGGTTINPVKPEQRWQQLSEGANYVLDHVGQARVLPLGVSAEDAAVSNLGQYFPSAYRVYSASGYASPLKLARYENFLDNADPVQAVQVLGVRYLLSLGQMGADVAATYPLVYGDDSFVYENKNPLPRTFIVHQAIQADSPAKALAHFQSREIDPRQTVILEAESTLPTVASPDFTGASTATIIKQNPQRIDIEANLAADGYLVLLDTFYPGWVATIDGETTLIYRANYLVRAIFIRAGEHLVQFEYRPQSFQLGLWFALLMITVLAATAIASINKIGSSRLHRHTKVNNLTGHGEDNSFTNVANAVCRAFQVVGRPE